VTRDILDDAIEEEVLEFIESEGEESNKESETGESSELDALTAALQAELASSTDTTE